MKKLKAENSFLGYISTKKKLGTGTSNVRIPVCLPLGEYEISRELSTYVELTKKVYLTENDITNEFFVRVKKSELVAKLDGNFSSVNYMHFENKNALNNISLEEFDPKDYTGNYIERGNEELAFFHGLERIELNSEFKSVGTVYWWEDRETGDTVFDGYEGILYDGSPPPYNRDFNWLFSIHDKIESFRSNTNKKPCIVISGNTCGIIYRSVPGRLYSINDCKVIHEKPTLIESLYSAMINFVKKYPNLEKYK